MPDDRFAIGCGNMPGRRQKGQVVVLLALAIFILVGFLAVVIDLGRLYVAKTGLQNAADAAALSGAKQLDGTASGICCNADSAVGRAQGIAAQNTFFSGFGQAPVTLAQSDVRFGNSPTGPWVDIAAAQASPADYLFIRIDAGSGNLHTWFAPIWNIASTGTYGMAVAGRFPPGNLTPMFVPAVRRNTDIARADTAVPYCNGVIYDPKDKNLKKGTCPYDPVNGGLVPYRVPDNTGNWGFLKPSESKTFPSFNGVADGVPNPEVGSYYIITPVPNNDASQAIAWTPGTSWNGNFGFVLASADQKHLNDLAAALCRGGSVTPYYVPGCGPVHPGNLSGPKMAANINTRFDLPDSAQVRLPHEACPSDTNIYDPGSAHWTTNGYYQSYLSGSPLVAPTNYPPGRANRRLINVYVVDNVWLQGDNFPGSNDDVCYPDSLKGGSQDAHLIGCAQFFLWTQADPKNPGKIIAEYVKALPADECGASTAAMTEIRLYQ